METITNALAIIAGLLVRLAIPIIFTLLLILLLRKLDGRWQEEAQLAAPVANIQKPECWKIKDCPPERVKNCIAAPSSLPCWQVYRLPNGYLREECLSCKVFTDAPMPGFQFGKIT